MFKKILVFLLAVLIVIQFFKPKKNIQEGIAANHISTQYAIPDDVAPILEKACYDCHSNNTRYPWYNNIQPVAWWLNNHVQEGKRELNFSEFTNRPLRMQYHKIDEAIDQVKKGEMPLNSYTWVHKDAILTDAEKEKLIGWAQSVMDSMKARYPIDSLIRKKA